MSVRIWKLTRPGIRNWAQVSSFFLLVVVPLLFFFIIVIIISWDCSIQSIFEAFICLFMMKRLAGTGAIPSLSHTAMSDAVKVDYHFIIRLSLHLLITFESPRVQTTHTHKQTHTTKNETEDLLVCDFLPAFWSARWDQISFAFFSLSPPPSFAIVYAQTIDNLIKLWMQSSSIHLWTIPLWEKE